MAKTLTEADILESYRAAQGMSKTDFAREMQVSRTQYYNYLNGVWKNDIGGLQESAVEYVGTWIGNLAVDLLKARGAVVPCVCVTEIGDNGHCPRHGLLCDGGGKA